MSVALTSLNMQRSPNSMPHVHGIRTALVEVFNCGMRLMVVLSISMIVAAFFIVGILIALFCGCVFEALMLVYMASGMIWLVMDIVNEESFFPKWVKVFSIVLPLILLVGSLLT